MYAIKINWDKYGGKPKWAKDPTYVSMDSIGTILGRGKIATWPTREKAEEFITRQWEEVVEI